jgi:V/A-type H+/Na+-transporting ATPase subunit I
MAIMKMKYVTFVTLATEGESLLRRLQDLGVLHPKHIEAPRENEIVLHLEHELHVQRQVVRELEVLGHGDDCGSGPKIDTEVSFDSVEGWLSDKKTITEKLSRLSAAIEKQEALGDFDPWSIKALSEGGISVSLWSSDKKTMELNSMPDGSIARELFTSGKEVFFAVVTKGDPVLLDWAHAVEVPARSLSSIQNEKSELTRELCEIDMRLDKAAEQLPRFIAEHKTLSNEHDFRVTLVSAFDDKSVSAFSGWLPECEVEPVRQSLVSFKAPVVMEARDPREDELPPVKTHNSWFARMFEPLLHMLGMPKYRGLDPALFFAPFMMLFFGICLGDAGYGFFMLIAAYIMKKKFSKKIPSMTFVANMTILMGVATIAWGLATGSIFGINFADRSWVLLDVSHGRGNPMTLFKISIGLGVIHLTIAFIMALSSAASWGGRIGKLGLIFVLWGGVFGVLHVPYWQVVLGLGILMIVGWSADSKNPIKRFGLGLWAVYGLSGLIGDVMSYARLFGLGIATGAIAGVVNMLAGDVRDAVPVAGYVLAILVLMVGHAFNFSMGIIGALVHPARLHAVEAFPKFVEMTGKPYEPLVK